MTEKVLFRCKDCDDEFEAEKGSLSNLYKCFKCGGSIERIRSVDTEMDQSDSEVTNQ